MFVGSQQRITINRPIIT